MAKHHPDLVIAANNPALPSGASAKSAMENASFAIPSSTPPPSSTFAMSAITAPSRDGVSFVAVLVSPMLIIARSV
eukprot:CAMPEP_0172535404 /NCGR_PEP_ID=MMETSP1067-20121228/7430_1 /TAXON_ID=265564 ORGANISM="Thalassiosira punctigera, Strain Tpunct2005C2" /NCGR_SAMPLE_ID=MMETSP1067 /ASSEMBLY_ACC=CAM_ASM_000444 /LENGTH=75 /DNA_ID=CAMNT_0013320337 /DNA_START=178 /DNA_END=406 /DNA_ORIENTATION=-